MNGAVKMDGELLLPGEQLQNKKTLSITEGGEKPELIKEII